jgi:hypothetical protein
MTGFRDFEVSEQAIRDAKACGLWGNVEKRLARMAKQAAPFTHPEANRRFESFLLKIENGVVVGVQKFDPNQPVNEKTDRKTRRRQKTAEVVYTRFDPNKRYRG